MPLSVASRLLTYLRDARFLDAGTHRIIAQITTLNVRVKVYGTWRMTIDRSRDGRFHGQVELSEVRKAGYSVETVSIILIDILVLLMSIGHASWLTAHWCPSFIEFLQVRHSPPHPSRCARI